MSLLSAIIQEADKASTEDLAKHRDIIFSKVKDVTEKVQMLSWSLQENLFDNHIHFTPTKSLEQLNYRTRKANIFADHDKLAEDIKSLEGTYKNIDTEFRSAVQKMTKAFSLLNDLCIAVEAKRELEVANHEFVRFRYTEAMLSCSELRQRLKKLNVEGKTETAVANIISQAENQYSIFAANLSIEWEDIFSWSEKKGIYKQTFSISVQQSDPIRIQNVLKALYATDRLNLELGLFSQFFIDQILHNVIRHNCEIFTEDCIAPDHTIVFSIQIDLEDATKPTFQTVYNNLFAIFDFLQVTLGSRFDTDKSFIAVFAKSIRGKFFNTIIEDCIRNNLPSCESSYETYKNLVVELDSFNKFLIKLKFVDAEDSPLNKFVEDTEAVLYNKKCGKLLFDVRELLNQSLSYGTVTVGMATQNNNDSIVDVTDKDALWDLNKPLFLPRCVISQNARSILATIMEHLEESAKLPEKYSRQLVSYIRSIAVMYQCVVPQKFKVNLECCPLDIALFFNNCFYLAHGLVGPPWSTVLPSPTAQHLAGVTLECIHDLRVLGLEKVSLYLQTQKKIIMESVNPDGVSEWSQETLDQFDGAINDALTLMRDLKQNWLHILPARMYQLSMCTLIQELCRAAVHRVLSHSRPVREHLVYMIAVRLEDVRRDLQDLLQEPIDLEKKIDIWHKFVRMPVVLKAQLLELSRLWNEQDKRVLSEFYTCEELRQIIKMRFPDDKYRLKILMEIQ